MWFRLFLYFLVLSLCSFEGRNQSAELISIGVWRGLEDTPSEFYRSDTYAKIVWIDFLERTLVFLGQSDVSPNEIDNYFTEVEIFATCLIIFRKEYSKKYDSFDYVPLVLPKKPDFDVSYFMREIEWKKRFGRELQYIDMEPQQIKDKCKIGGISDLDYDRYIHAWRRSRLLIGSLKLRGRQK